MLRLVVRVRVRMCIRVRVRIGVKIGIRGAPARAYVHGGVGVSVAVLREALEPGYHLCGLVCG